MRVGVRIVTSAEHIQPVDLTFLEAPEAQHTCLRVTRRCQLQAGGRRVAEVGETVPVTKLRRSGRVRQPPEPTPLAPPLSDAALSERLAQGDRWAQEAVYRKYVQVVWGLALRLMGNRADAEDVVQATFAEVLGDARQARERRMLRCWLVGVAVQQAQRKLRRRRVLRALGFERGEHTHRLDEQAGRSLDSELASDLRTLGELLDRMTTRRRVAWCLRYMEGCSLDEVASYCACSLVVAKRELNAAQRAVQQHFTIAEPSDV